MKAHVFCACNAHGNVQFYFFFPETRLVNLNLPAADMWETYSEMQEASTEIKVCSYNLLGVCVCANTPHVPIHLLQCVNPVFAEGPKARLALEAPPCCFGVKREKCLSSESSRLVPNLPQYFVTAFTERSSQPSLAPTARLWRRFHFAWYYVTDSSSRRTATWQSDRAVAAIGIFSVAYCCKQRMLCLRVALAVDTWLVAGW